MGHVAGVLPARAATPTSVLALGVPPFCRESRDEARRGLRNAPDAQFPARHGVLRHAKLLGKLGLRDAESRANLSQFVARHRGRILPSANTWCQALSRVIWLR